MNSLKAGYLAAIVMVLGVCSQPVFAYGKLYLWGGEDLSGISCSQQAANFVVNEFGPFDFTSERDRSKMLSTVERIHYTRKMRDLKGGNTGPIENDLHYTLHMFPNHHDALFTLVQLYTGTCKLCRPKKAPIQSWKAYPPPECYLNRATGLHQTDPMLRLIYGVYLHRVGEAELAATQYEAAIKYGPELPEAHYNYGLALVDLGRLEEAQVHAEEATKLGYPLKGLQRKLKRKMREAARSQGKAVSAEQ